MRGIANNFFTLGSFSLRSYTYNFSLFVKFNLKTNEYQQGQIEGTIVNNDTIKRITVSAEAQIPCIQAYSTCMFHHKQHLTVQMPVGKMHNDVTSIRKLLNKKTCPPLNPVGRSKDREKFKEKIAN